MSHLGSRISALVDGQLSVADTERALAHVAVCPECSAELAASRAARRALAAADEVAPTPDLTARLLSLAALDRHARGRPVRPAGAAVARRARRRTAWPAGAWARGLARRAGRCAATSVTAASSVAHRRRLDRRVSVRSPAMLFVLGERPDVVPTVHPGADLGLLGQARPGPGRRPAVRQPWPVADGSADASHQTVAWLRAHGWSFPAELPAGWTVTAVRWSGDELAGARGRRDGRRRDPLVVTEQQGRLDTTALAGAPTSEVGGREVYVLSFEPWHVVWQSDATVVQVVASQSSGSAETLVAAFPGGAFDDGVPARITRGWNTVTGVLDRP